MHSDVDREELTEQGGRPLPDRDPGAHQDQFDNEE
jgi:hypothetical protein